jgi:hypothetical protein
MTMRNRGAAAVAVLALSTLPVPARADVVTDWNLTTVQVAAAAGVPQRQHRVAAMVHAAMHDAVGFHFRTSVRHGANLGRQVGHWTFHRSLQPLRDRR